jgi:hypothetical protein
LDYNYQAPYFGVFSSNHPAQAASYWGPILDWMPSGRTKAQVEGGLAHVTCPPHALYYACHLAPWGLMSLDGMTRYMAWNGAFASLLLINAFEYTRNATFANGSAYPLLDGLNAWWGCYLDKTATGPGPDDYAYMDTNQFNPDYEHEGQRVPNPQIAISFVARTITAQVDMAASLGLTPPPLVADIAAHLPPFNTAQLNVTTNVTFALLNDTRCSVDSFTWANMATLQDCEAACASRQPDCDIFSYCPPPGIDGCTGENDQPKPFTCWGYTADKLPNCITNATKNLGWMSGVRNASGPATSTTVWSAYEGASVADTDWFASYPTWPTEALLPGAPGGDPATAAIAQASSVLYADFPTGRPVDLFSMAVLAGYNASAPPSQSFTPAAVLAGFNAYLANFWGPNLLPYAPGGGIENTGITRAVNDMLLQAVVTAPATGPTGAQYTLSLFPFWPAEEPAAFTTLLAKGGFLVSAAWSNATRAVASPVTVSAAYALPGVAAPTCCMYDMYGGGPAGGLAVTCAGAAVPATWAPDGRSFCFAAPLGAQCSVAKGA